MRKVLPKKCVLIPEMAKKVFSGQMFDVYQWEQKLFDGSYATFEMLKRPDSMQIIAIKEGKVIILEDEQPGRGPLLCLPGGRPEPTDISWEAAARRELLEETGMAFKTWKLVDVSQPVRKIEWFSPVFVATDFESQVDQKLDAGEKIRINMVDFSAFRAAVFSDEDPKLSYLRLLLIGIKTIEELQALKPFSGQEIER